MARKKYDPEECTRWHRYRWEFMRRSEEYQTDYKRALAERKNLPNSVGPWGRKPGPLERELLCKYGLPGHEYFLMPNPALNFEQITGTNESESAPERIFQKDINRLIGKPVSVSVQNSRAALLEIEYMLKVLGFKSLKAMLGLGLSEAEGRTLQEKVDEHGRKYDLIPADDRDKELKATTDELREGIRATYGASEASYLDYWKISIDVDLSQINSLADLKEYIAHEIQSYHDYLTERDLLPARNKRPRYDTEGYDLALMVGAAKDRGDTNREIARELQARNPSIAEDSLLRRVNQIYDKFKNLVKGGYKELRFP